MEYIKASKEKISTIDSPYLNVLFSSLAIYSLFFFSFEPGFCNFSYTTHHSEVFWSPISEVAERENPQL